MYVSVLDDTGAVLNLVNIEYHLSFSEHQPNLVFKFEYLKDLDDVDSLNIILVDEGNENEEVKVGIDVTVVITYKTHFVVNRQTATFSLDLG